MNAIKNENPTIYVLRAEQGSSDTYMNFIKNRLIKTHVKPDDLVKIVSFIFHLRCDVNEICFDIS